MAKLVSSELKAVLVMDDFLDNPMSVLKENCLTLQHFSYESEHDRKINGTTYGQSRPTILNIVVRVTHPRHAKTFYHEMAARGHYHFSILFNVKFGDSGRIASHENGMVADGYIVRIEEAYTTGKNPKGEDEQMLLNVKILLRSITYIGEQQNHQSVYVY